MTEDQNMYDALTGMQTSCDGTPLKKLTMDYAETGGHIYPYRVTESVCGGEAYEKYRIAKRDSCGNVLRIVTNGCDTDVSAQPLVVCSSTTSVLHWQRL